MQDEEEHLVHDKEGDFFILEQTALELLEVRPPEYESYSGRVQKERERLFVPSMLKGRVFVLS